MNYDKLEVLKTIYAEDSSCILILDSDLRLIWQNGKNTPFVPDDNLPSVLRLPKAGRIESGDYSYYVHDIIYEYHLTNAADEYYIISCSDIPAFYKHFENRFSRENLENTLIRSRLETMRISASAAQLNDYFEEIEDDNINYEELNEQTNIIMKSCSGLLREQYLTNELLRYYSQDETESSVVNCSEIIRTFAKKCGNIIGPRGSTKISCDISDNIFINASYCRMEYFLLCLLVLLRKKYPGIYQLKISASEFCDEIVIHMKLIPTGEDEQNRPLLSEFIPLYKDVPVYEMENLIVRKFLERYNGVFIDSTESGNYTFSLRFPAAEAGASIRLAAKNETISGECIITPYHAILCDISDFRYY